MKLYSHSFRSNDQLKHLFLQRYERYLPTAFDESMSVLEKINKVIESQNKLIDVVNDHREYTNDQLFKAFEIVDTNLKKSLDDFLEIIQDTNKQFNDLKDYVENSQLPETVEEKLETWLLDGTIDELIVDTVFPEWVERLFVVENKFSSLNMTVKDYGASGDGVEDDTEPFREAGLSGRTIRIPEGKYLIKGAIELVDGTQFIGDGDNTVIINDGTPRMLFTAYGSYGDSVSVSQNSKMGDHFINVSSVGQFKTNDMVEIMSQRYALSRQDAGKDWLGVATSSHHTLYLGEVREVSSVTGSQLNFRGGLLYSGYNSNDNEETHPLARRNATVRKVNYLNGIKLKDFKVDGNFSQVARLSLCKDAVVDGVTWVNAEDGTHTAFHDCYASEGRNLKCQYLPNKASSGGASRNGYKTISSQNTGFDNVEMDHGTQCVDFTYGTGKDSIPNNNSYLTNSRIRNAVHNSMTAHGGTYAPVISNNQFLNCHSDGLSVRSREAVITNNRVMGGGDMDTGLSYGITLYQGAAQDVVVSGNSITGFHNGIATRDGNEEDKFEYVGLNATNNTITKIQTAFSLRRTNNKTTAESHINISNNHASQFIGSYGKFVNIYEYYHGVKIKDNIFIGSGANNGGIFTRGNCLDIEVSGNTFRNITNRSIMWLGDVTDTELLGTGNYYYKFTADNDVIGTIDLEWTGNLQNRPNYYSHHLYPSETGIARLGFSHLRFDTVFTVNSPNTASDYNLKENISGESLGIDFLNKLKPVTYNMKQDDSKKRKHGLIAQEVEKVLQDGSIVSKPTDENDFYGLEYEQLIPILVKAIQEIDDKMK